MKIITNNKPRQIIYGYELTDKQKQGFDYVDADYIDCSNFVKYKNNIYDLSEFMRVENNDELKGWDGYSSDSFFSGTLIKYADDMESVIMGWYYS